MSNFLTGLMVAGITVLTLTKWEVQRIVDALTAAMQGIAQ
jgi:hypothetical protein